jgi:hypothetical protein
MAACVCDSALSGEVRFSAKGWRVQRRAGAPDVGRRGAVGSVQGSRGSSSVQGRVWRVFGRGACLTRVVRRSRSGLGTTLWLCSCKRKARQGKAQAGGEGEAGSGSDLWVPAPWSGLPEGEVQTGRRWSWWWRRVCLFLNNGLSMYSVGTTVDVDAALCWWRERGGALSQRAESLAVTYPCLDSRSNFQLNARRPVRTFLLPSCLHSIAKNTSIPRHAHHTQTIKLTLGKDTCITRSNR